MKRILVLFVILIPMLIPFGFIASSQADAQVFKELTGCDGVEAVNIGKFAMRIAKETIVSNSNFIPKNGIKSLDGMEMIKTANNEAKDSVRAVLARVIEEGNYEPLIESKEHGETSAIYTILPAQEEDESICHNILVVTENGWGEIEIVLIKGAFDINRIVKNVVEPIK